MSLTTPYVIVRTRSAGVFAGQLKEQTAEHVVLLQSRRIWFWDGAATLSELANEGTSKPENCKFPAPIKGEHLLPEVIEIIETTPEAQRSIEAVPVWTEHA